MEDDLEKQLAFEAMKTELKNTAVEILGNYPLHNDICHRKAGAVAKRLVEGLERTGAKDKHGVSLLHLVGHSVACLTNRDSGVKMVVNTGFPLEDIPDNFYFFGQEFPHLVFGNPEVEQIESKELRSDREVDEALAWSVSEAKRNKHYY